MVSCASESVVDELDDDEELLDDVDVLADEVEEVGLVDDDEAVDDEEEAVLLDVELLDDVELDEDVELGEGAAVAARLVVEGRVESWAVGGSRTAGSMTQVTGTDGSELSSASIFDPGPMAFFQAWKRCWPVEVNSAGSVGRVIGTTTWVFIGVKVWALEAHGVARCRWSVTDDPEILPVTVTSTGRDVIE